MAAGNPKSCFFDCDKWSTIDTRISKRIALMIVCDMSTSQRHLGRGLFFWPHAVGEKPK